MAIFILCFALSGCNNGIDDEEISKSRIVGALEQWPMDFNAGRIGAVCDLFAPDLIATYPGAPDKNYEQMCSQLTAVISDETRMYGYAAPQIEQIIVEGDLAAVRLIWTLTSGEKGKAEATVVKERGLDIFKRQPDGSWKISVSYAYPM